MQYYLEKLLTNTLEMYINYGENKENLFQNILDKVSTDEYYIQNPVELSKKLPFHDEIAELVETKGINVKRDTSDSPVLVLGDAMFENEVRTVDAEIENVYMKMLIEDISSEVEFARMFAERIDKEAKSYDTKEVRLEILTSGVTTTKLLAAMLKDKGYKVKVPEELMGE